MKRLLNMEQRTSGLEENLALPTALIYRTFYP